MDRLKLNIQLFAEEEYEEINEEDILSLDEILEDPYYQAQFDKKLAKATETATKNAIAKWEKEQAAKIEESQKLASMDEIQKRDYEIENLKKQNEEFKQRETANSLRAEAIKQAAERGIPIGFMNEIDYTKENADSISKKIDTYGKELQRFKDNTIADYSREAAPQTGERANTSKSKEQMSYEELCNLPEYKN